MKHAPHCANPLTSTGFTSTLEFDAAPHHGSLARNLITDDLTTGASMPPVDKLTILYVATNPHEPPRWQQAEEFRAIDQVLRLTEQRDHFNLVGAWAVRHDDLQDLLLRHNPHIVHFSGRGTPAGEVVLQDAIGHMRPVPPNAISELFQLLKNNVRCVVLNTCYSDVQANGIVDAIDCVVGTSSAATDQAAIEFAVGFYLGLGYGRNLSDAFHLGSNRIQLAGFAEDGQPAMLLRQGISPELLALLSAPGTLSPAEIAAELDDAERYVATDTVQTLAILFALEAAIRRTHMERPLLRRLQWLWAAVSTGEACGRLLFLIGKQLRLSQVQDRRDGSDAVDTLRKMVLAQHYPAPATRANLAGLAEHLERVVPYLAFMEPARPNVDLPAENAALDTLLESLEWLHHWYVHDAYEVVVQTIAVLCEKGWGTRKLEDLFQKAEMRRLLRDRRLEAHFGRFSAFDYVWPQLLTPARQQTPSHLGRWLDSIDLATNPFGPTGGWHDPLLFRTWSDPAGWDVAQAQTHTQITFQHRDHNFVRAYLTSQFQKLCPEPHFVVQAPLMSSIGDRSPALQPVVAQMAHALAKTWLKFLACNPDVFMQLPDSEQEALSSLMGWAVKDSPAFSSRLERAYNSCAERTPLDPTALWRHMESHRAGSVSDVSDRFEDWVQVRPTKTSTTFLFAYATSTSPDIHARATELSALLAQLEQWDVWVKLFVPEDFDKLDWRCDQVTLEWSSAQLCSTINQRIYAAVDPLRGSAYDRNNAFASLLDNPPGLQVLDAEDAVHHLSVAANGSLSRLLDLGNALLARPAQRHADGMWGAKITPEDLDAVLGPYDPS